MLFSGGIDVRRNPVLTIGRTIGGRPESVVPDVVVVVQLEPARVQTIRISVGAVGRIRRVVERSAKRQKSCFERVVSASLLQYALCIWPVFCVRPALRAGAHRASTISLWGP